MAVMRDHNGVSFTVENEWMSSRIRFEFGIFTRVVHLTIDDAEKLAGTLTEMVAKAKEFHARQSSGGSK